MKYANNNANDNFILKALFVLKIFQFLSSIFGLK